MADPTAPASTEPAGEMDAGTRRFLESAASSNQLEIRSSELALERTQNEETRAFARQMIAAHEEIGDRLSAVLSDARLARPVGMPLTADHQDRLTRLQNTSDADFDEEYRRLQLFAHQEALVVFSEYSKTGRHDSLRNFAGTTFQQIEEHLDDTPSPRAD